MLEYYEVSPLPEICQDCHMPDCGECDHALDRWHLTPDSAQWLQELIKQRKQEQKRRFERKRGVRVNDTGLLPG